MGRVKIKFHPLFFVFIFILILSKNFFSVISFLIAVFLHELGHGLIADFLGYKLNQITFLPFGASISGKENVFYSTKHEIIVAVCGPLVNLFLLILCYALFWCFPSIYCYLDIFYYANLVLFIFNFLPIFPLDGGRVLFAILKNKHDIKKAYKIIKIVGVVLSLCLFSLFVISSFFEINYTLGVTSIFLLFGIFFEDNSSYYITNFNFTNKTKKLSCGIDGNLLIFNTNVKLYKILRKLNKFKYNVVCIVNCDGEIIKSFTEEEIYNFLMLSSLDAKINDFI